MQEDRRPESGSATTNAAETAARSPLDKPLSQLTEEDIAQLTREDCRRFLKEKGLLPPPHLSPLSLSKFQLLGISGG